MDFGWLIWGVVDPIWALAQWLRRQPPLFLIALPTALLILAQLLRVLNAAPVAHRAVSCSHRRSAPADTGEVLKEQLRLRLAEPSALFGGTVERRRRPWAPRQALEGDIEAAAKSGAAEAGGRRGKAKQLLRRRRRQWPANGKLNGSEAAYLAPARRAVADRQHAGCAGRLCASRRSGARRCRGADAAGCANLRAGKLEAAEAAFRRQMRLGGGAGVSPPATAPAPCWATCRPPGRPMQRWPPMRRRSARWRRCGARCRKTPSAARPLRHVRPHRRHAAGQRRRRAGAGKLP